MKMTFKEFLTLSDLNPTLSTYTGFEAGMSYIQDGLPIEDFKHIIMTNKLARLGLVINYQKELIHPN